MEYGVDIFVLLKRYRSKILICFFATMAIVILGVIVSNFIAYSSRPTALNVLLAPSSATAIFEAKDSENQLSSSDKRTVKSSYYELAPGDYHVTVSADGFKKREVDIHVSEKQIKAFQVFLACDAYMPNAAKYDFSCYEESFEERAILKYLIEQPSESNLAKFDEDIRKTASESLARFDKITLLKQKLPLYHYNNENSGDSASIGTSKRIIIADGNEVAKCQSSSFCLMVYGDNPPKQTVVKMLADVGVKYDDFEVVYE